MPLLSRITTRRWLWIRQSLLIVGWALSNHPNDTQEAEPTLEAIASAIGIPQAAALDAGYFGPATLAACAKRGIEPYIATGRDPHHPSWQQRFAPLPDPPPEEASSQVKMAYKLKTALGKAIYGARKCTVEPVIGIIKEVLGFRQFSLRGTGGCWRVVSGLFGFQSQALPYLILGLTRAGMVEYEMRDADACKSWGHSSSLFPLQPPSLVFSSSMPGRAEYLSYRRGC